MNISWHHLKRKNQKGFPSMSPETLDDLLSGGKINPPEAPPLPPPLPPTLRTTPPQHMGQHLFLILIQFKQEKD